jgi:hypothetical protein
MFAPTSALICVLFHDGEFGVWDLDAQTLVARCRIRTGTALARCRIRTGTALARCHIRTGTALARCHIRTGTALARCRIRTGTALARCRIRTGTALARCNALHGTARHGTGMRRALVRSCADLQCELDRTGLRSCASLIALGTHASACLLWHALPKRLRHVRTPVGHASGSAGGWSAAVRR